MGGSFFYIFRLPCIEIIQEVALNRLDLNQAVLAQRDGMRGLCGRA